MRRLSHVLIAFVLAGLISSCAAATRVSTPASSDPDSRLTALTDLDRRVADVAWRLSQSNADLCPTVRSGLGWALHSARQYSPELRTFAEARFGVSGDLPGVLAAPPGSPVADAGLGPGDLIVSVNGQPLDAGSGTGPARHDGLKRNTDVLDEAFAKGETVLSVRREGSQIDVRVRPRRVCGYDVQLNPSDELNARADGRRLFISTALAGFAQTDDELAVILGHELAHHVLGHREWNETGGAGRIAGAAPSSTRGDPEREADRVGLILMARAGYDEAAAAPFWRRFGASNWRVRYPQLGHDSAGARAEALEGLAREIAARQERGETLEP